MFTEDTDRSQSASAIDISKVGPGAYASNPEQLPDSTAYMERMTMDIDMLKNQYKRLRTRQKQAHIILAGMYYQFMGPDVDSVSFIP